MSIYCNEAFVKKYSRSSIFHVLLKTKQSQWNMGQNFFHSHMQSIWLYHMHHPSSYKGPWTMVIFVKQNFKYQNFKSCMLPSISAINSRKLGICLKENYSESRSPFPSPFSRFSSGLLALKVLALMNKAWINWFLAISDGAVSERE